MARDTCATREEVESWFDAEGRLIEEAAMRRTLFEVGVDPSYRRRLWKFLFGVYPCDSTLREQKAWDLEHRARYRALRERWEVLDRAVTAIERGRVVCAKQPFYMDLSDGEDHPPGGQHHRHTAPVEGEKKKVRNELLSVPGSDASHVPSAQCESASDGLGTRCVSYADSDGSVTCSEQEGSGGGCGVGVGVVCCGSLMSRCDSVVSCGDGPASENDVFVGGCDSGIETFVDCDVKCIVVTGSEGVAVGDGNVVGDGGRGTCDGCGGNHGNSAGVVEVVKVESVGEDDGYCASGEGGSGTGHYPLDSSGTGHYLLDNSGTGHYPLDTSGTGHWTLDSSGTGHYPLDSSGTGHYPLNSSGTGHWTLDSSGTDCLLDSSGFCYDVGNGVSSDNELDEEERTVLQILEFPSRVSATKERVDLENAYQLAKKVILSDVVRTDRDSHFFTHKRNLRKVHRILMIYALFHPGLGYAQGMNDILVRFLVVMRSEVDAYWMFSKYMEHKVRDFMEEGYMLARFATVKRLLEEFDPETSKFLKTSECHELLFCDRWLLIDFKREFSMSDSIRLLEVLSTHHLERYVHTGRSPNTSSCHKCAPPSSEDRGLDPSASCAPPSSEDRGLDPSASCAPPSSEDRGLDPSANCSYELFICTAILIVHKRDVCVKKDAASIYGAINSLAMKMDLKAVLSQAKEMYLCHHGSNR